MQPEPLQSEIHHDDEPRYLRRQRPLEIKRRRFSRRARDVYRSVFFGVAAVLAAALLTYATINFLLNSPRVSLANVSAIEVLGNRFVPSDTIREYFIDDQGRSVLRIPLDDRRAALEQIPWVERAEVLRLFPNRLRVTLIERAPIAFLRIGSDLALIDATGIILDRPPAGEFRFPIVTGIGPSLPRDERARRMTLLVEFLSDLERVRTGASETVSEVDFSDPRDLRASLEPGGGIAAQWDMPIRVHFGDAEFFRKYSVFLENIPQWMASTGRVESIDLRFDRQVVVNPEPRFTRPPTNPSAEAKLKSQQGRPRPAGKVPPGAVAEARN